MSNNFRDALTDLINAWNMESGSNTPDYILADYLVACLRNYNETVNSRSSWYDRYDHPGQSNV